MLGKQTQNQERLKKVLFGLTQMEWWRKEGEKLLPPPSHSGDRRMQRKGGREAKRRRAREESGGGTENEKRGEKRDVRDFRRTWNVFIEFELRFEGAWVPEWLLFRWRDLTLRLRARSCYFTCNRQMHINGVYLETEAAVIEWMKRTSVDESNQFRSSPVEY